MKLKEKPKQGTVQEKTTDGNKKSFTRKCRKDMSPYCPRGGQEGGIRRSHPLIGEAAIKRKQLGKRLLRAFRASPEKREESSFSAKDGEGGDQRCHNSWNDRRASHPKKKRRER